MRQTLLAIACLALTMSLAAQPIPFRDGIRPAASADAQFFSALGAARSALMMRDASRLPAVAAPAPVAVDPIEDAVAALLAGTNVPASFVTAAFADPRKRAEPSVPGQVQKPAESLPYPDYKKIFLTPQRIDLGAQFYRDHQQLLSQVSAAYGVDALLLTSLVGVETYYGRGMGRYLVFNALYTMATNVPARAPWAERELSEFLKLCYADGVDVYSVKGSYAGAFGYGQFIPSTFNHYAVDFDGDGLKRWDSWPDSLATSANYLAKMGYKSGTTDFTPHSADWNAIFAYNHHDNYVHVVIDLRAAIADKLAPASGGGKQPAQTP